MLGGRDRAGRSGWWAESVVGETGAVITLEGPSARILIDPQQGGRVAAATLLGRPVLVERTPDAGPMAWGSYPMVPYAGRVRAGRFDFDGAEWNVPVTLGGNAIHGTTFDVPWETVSATATSCALRVALGERWPLGGWVEHLYVLGEHTFTCELVVHAAERAMPAQVGWHPWFLKPEELVFDASSMYRRDDAGLPTGELVPVPAGPWDDCFTGVRQPVVLRWDTLEVAVRSDCARWVVYDQPDHATCVEPQSGPPDGFTIEPEVVPAGGVLRRTMTWQWHARSA